MHHHRWLAFLGIICILQTSLPAQQPPTPAFYVRLMLAHTILQSTDIPFNLAERADRQLLTLLAQDGSKEEDRFSAFVVAPMLGVMEKTLTDTPSVRHNVKLTMHLVLTQAFTGQILLKKSIVLAGSGTTDQEAMVRAMAGVRNNNGAITQALEDFRVFAADHLEKQCGVLRKTAQDSAGRKNYRAAVALLHAIPPGTVCYSTVQDAKNLYFQNLLNENCDSLLNESRQASAGADPARALRLLSFLAADSPCFPEVKKFSGVLEKEATDEALRQRYQWLLAYFRDGEAAERAQWNALNAWGLDYLRREARFALVGRL